MANIRFVQAQTFQLQAAGAAAGDTTIILQSFKYPDGTTNIVTADLGDQCFATLEPNGATQEEPFLFTGVTQNSNGTATLTGVSTVGFKYPYTATSGLSKSHSGGVNVIISNDAGFYGKIKDYIDGIAISGSPLATNLVAGLTTLSVAAATGNNPIAVGDNDSRLPTTAEKSYLTAIKSTSLPYALDSTGASAYTITLSPVPSTLASGQYFEFKASSGNAGAVTLNVNSLGAKAIRKNFNSALASGDILAGQIIGVSYDVNNSIFQLQTPVSGFPLSSNGTTTKVTDSTTTTVIAHGLPKIPTSVDIFAYVPGSTTVTETSNGTFDASGQRCLATKFLSGTTNRVDIYSNAVAFNDQANGDLQGTVTVDATNITITWVKAGTPTSYTATLLWRARTS